MIACPRESSIIVLFISRKTFRNRSRKIKNVFTKVPREFHRFYGDFSDGKMLYFTGNNDLPAQFEEVYRTFRHILSKSLFWPSGHLYSGASIRNLSSILSVVFPLLLVPLILGDKVVEKLDGMAFPLSAAVFDVVRAEVAVGKTILSPFSFVLPALVGELSVVELYLRPAVVEELLPVELVMSPPVVVAFAANRELNLVEVDADDGVDVHFSLVKIVVGSAWKPVGKGDAT